MNPADCLAVHQGELKLAALNGPVTIVRDRWGIPHIKAGSLHDAFFAQGFCLGQDRLWQLELLRSMAHGRAASLLNRGLLGLDRQNRMLGFGRLAALEWEHQSAEARAVLQAYAEGVNAAISMQPRPFEFEVIGHRPAPWSPIDSLAIIKLVSSNQQWASKLKFGQVAALLGPHIAAALIPDVPPGASLIVPSGAKWTGQRHPFDADIERAMGEPDGIVAAGGGSNCWVVHGSRTESGKPLVAGDPHLQMTLPGQWYVLHMECPDFIAAGPCNPGYPGPVFYGHNTHVAWTMTHAQGDRWDLYRERIRHGSDGPEYLFEGEWQALESREETFEVRDGDPVTNRTWATRHGPIVFGDPLSDEEVIAARWGLAEPAHDVDATLAVLRAHSAAEARAGFKAYDSVSGNFCFADLAGDIGYQYAGRIPLRPAQLVPVPGWTGAHEWQGDVQRDELPAGANPTNGYFITANNRTTGPDFPYYLTYVTSRFRADRLGELFEARERFDVQDMRDFQGDITSVAARELAPIFASAPVPDGPGRLLQQTLVDWDGRLAGESPAALAYDALCEALTERTLRATLSRASIPITLTPYEQRRIIIDHVQSRDTAFLALDGTWEEAIAAAIVTAADQVVARFGADPAAWRWDAVHEVRWRHNLGRQAEFAPLLNLPPVPIGGDGTTPFATTSDHDKTVMAGVSYRQIFDLADLNAAQICIPPGNSGQPGSPHYADNVERWRNVEYHPLYIKWDDIEANAEARLNLAP